MTCVHLQQLYRVCQQNDIRLSSSDLVRIVCRQCQQEEVCPSVLLGDFETKYPEVTSNEENGDVPHS